MAFITNTLTTRETIVFFKIFEHTNHISTHIVRIQQDMFPQY